METVQPAPVIAIDYSGHPQRVRRTPALALLFLAPALAELLTGSTPIASFFNPVLLFLNVGLYGTAAVLIREVARRRGLGWTSILLMGCAYGIVEEGLWIQSFFNEHHWDLGNLAVYGRAMGVNWVWAQQLIVFHAVWSIAASIALCELIFPAVRHEPWLNRRWAMGITGLFVLDFIAGFALFTAMFHKQFSYVPPALPYLGSVVAAVLLVRLALRLRPAPTPLELPMVRAAARIWVLIVLGMVAVFGYFAISGALTGPESNAPVPVSMLILAAWPLGGWALVRRWSAPGRRWDDRHRLALVSGPLLFFAVFFDMIALPQAQRPDKNFAGQWLVGVIAVILLILLARRVRRRTCVQGDCATPQGFPVVT